MKQWCVYILRCKDDTLYTGSTEDFPKRLEAHRQGKGAKYTRGRSPLEPVYVEPCPHKSAALKREYAIKQLSRREKLVLIASWNPRETECPTENPPTENLPTEHLPAEYPPTENPPTEYPLAEHPFTAYSPPEHPMPAETAFRITGAERKNSEDMGIF